MYVAYLHPSGDASFEGSERGETTVIDVPGLQVVVIPDRGAGTCPKSVFLLAVI